MAAQIKPSRLPFLVSADLLTELDRLYPPRPLRPEATHVEHVTHAAKRQLIDDLWAALRSLETADPLSNPILGRK